MTKPTRWPRGAGRNPERRAASVRAAHARKRMRRLASKLGCFDADYIAGRLAAAEARSPRSNGYVYINAPRHPSAPVSNGQIAEHRLVMEIRLGRYLLPGESVHHVNGVRDDNRPDNLELWQTPQRQGIRNTDAINWASDILKRNRPAKLTATDLAM